jgi:phage shock protein PspC (stress-responsive transcriptional regulator)
MERVVTINLNGNPYQLEEPAYEAVRAYLERAEAALADNPDKNEVLRDLEQAIADKCAGYLSPAKSVVAADEMTKIIAEMGPVEGEGAAASEGAQAQAGAATRKRLYRIREGANIAGVCAGLAAYFDIDVNIIRLLFIVLTIITSGGMLLVYVAMMFLIPSAHTSEEWAAAHGVPFNAQEVIDRAKREYRTFTENGPPWTWPRWRRRQWKREMRESWRNWAYSRGWGRWNYGPASAPPPAGPVTYVGRIIAGVFALIFGLIRAVLAIVFLALLFTLVVYGSLGSWPLPPHIAIWQAIVGLVLVYALILIPLRFLAHVIFGAFGGYGYWGYHGGSGLASLVFLGLAVWLAYTFVPEAREVIQHIPDAIRAFADGLRGIIDQGANGARALFN